VDKKHKEGLFIGQIESGIDKQDNLALGTIDFVRRQLPAWRDDPERPYEEAENKLNLQLCKFLDVRARNSFPMVRFDHEEYQIDPRRSVDVSASPVEATIVGARLYTIFDPILVLECKRLPAPSKDREREYITGGKEQTSGGIQRFKLGLHGANLDLAAMIGYVQARTAREWHRTINGWILELAGDKNADACVWDANEILEPLDEFLSKGLVSCASTHGRTGGKPLRIHHFWIAMNKKA